MNNHTSFRKHQPVLVILRNGERFIDKFVELRSTYYVLRNHKRVPINTIRSMSIYKAKTSENNT